MKNKITIGIILGENIETAIRCEGLDEKNTKDNLTLIGILENTKEIVKERLKIKKNIFI